MFYAPGICLSNICLILLLRRLFVANFAGAFVSLGRTANWERCLFCVAEDLEVERLFDFVAPSVFRREFCLNICRAGARRGEGLRFFRRR